MRKKAVLISLMHPDIDLFENVCLESVAACMRKSGYEAYIYKVEYNNIDYEYIEKLKPDIIGFTPEYCIVNSIESVTSNIKSRLDNAIIFSFGHYVSYNYEFILTHISQMDFVVIGEPEIVILDIIEAIDEAKSIDSVLGIAYYCNNEIKVNNSKMLCDNLDELPFAARDLIMNDNKVALVFSSKGCTGNCTFCGKNYFEPKWRGRSPQNFVKEIIEIEEKIKPNIYMISDCSFEDPDIHGNRISNICKEIIDNDLEIYYCTSFKATFHKMTNEKISELLIQSGLIAALVGIESGNEDDLRLYNKAASLSDNREIIEYFNDLGVLVIPSFICFNPFSTRQRLQENLLFLRNIKQCARFFTFLDILEYTPMFKIVGDVGLLVKKGQEDGNYSYNYSLNDNCVHQYTFENLEVGILAKHLKNVLVQLNRTDLFDDFIYFYEKHMMHMTYFSRKAARNNQKELFDLINKHMGNINAIIRKFDDILFNWIEELLNVMEGGINISTLEMITYNHHIYDEFDIVVNLLKFERNNVIRKVYRINKMLIEQWM